MLSQFDVSIQFPELADRLHEMVGEFFVCPKPVGPFIKFAEVDRFAEPDADFLATRPISQYLLRQVVAKPGDEDRYHLRP